MKCILMPKQKAFVFEKSGMRLKKERRRGKLLLGWVVRE